MPPQSLTRAEPLLKAPVFQSVGIRYDKCQKTPEAAFSASAARQPHLVTRQRLVDVEAASHLGNDWSRKHENATGGSACQPAPTFPAK